MIYNVQIWTFSCQIFKFSDHDTISFPFIFWLNKATVMSFLFQLASLSQKILCRTTSNATVKYLYNAQVLKWWPCMSDGQKRTFFVPSSMIKAILIVHPIIFVNLFNFIQRLPPHPTSTPNIFTFITHLWMFYQYSNLNVFIFFPSDCFIQSNQVSVFENLH